jgi:hypothetical protein
MKTHKEEMESILEGKIQPKREPPEKLGKLIKLVNLLPADIMLSSLDRVRSDNAHNYTDYDHLSRLNKNKKPFEIWTFDARWELAKKLKGLPKKYKKKFRQYIYGDTLPEAHPLLELAITEKSMSEIWDSTRRAVERYEDFCQLREQLDLIAEFAMRHPSMLRELDNLKGENATVKKIKKQVQDKVFSDYKDQIKDDGFLNENKIKNLLLPLSGIVKFEIDSRGIIKSKASQLVEATLFSEREIDILRIRKCQICDKIFWAKRNDSFACDAECGNKLRELVKEKKTSTQEVKDAAAKKKREYRLIKKVRRLTNKYKDRELKIQNSAIFDSTRTEGSFKLEKGTKITVTNFEWNRNSDVYPIQCNVRSEAGKDGFFTIQNDKKTPYRIKLKLGTN